MSSRAEIIITLIDRKGPMGCHRGHRIGDCYDFDSERGQLCPMAMHVAFPYVDILRYGGQIPGNSENRAVFCCPDVETINVYRIEKITSCYSERLELRPLTVKDAQDVLNIAGKDAVAKYMRFDTLKSYQEAVDLILQLTSGINQAWLVRSKQTLQAIGVLALKQSDCETVRDVTLFLDEPFWHCGYGRELLSWAKVYAHDRLRASTLQAYVAMENKACQNLLESLHFQIEKRFDYEDQSVLVYRGS